MSFIHGISQHTEQGYKYTDILPVTYPEQVKALTDLKFEKAAVKYWEIVEATRDHGQACNAIRYMLTAKELQSDDFAHILHKRQRIK